MAKTKKKRALCAMLALLCALALQPATAPTARANDNETWVEETPDDEEGAAPFSPSSTAGNFTVKAIKRLAEEITVPDAFIEAVEDEASGGKISEKTFKRLVQEHKAPSEFIQRFFDDCVVYNDYGTIKYASIDPDLPKNNYDWDMLVHKASGEIKYMDGDVSRALKGIDVSQYQGKIDWEAVKDDGVRFAFIRLGYRGYGTGKLVLDEYFERNIENALDAGVDVGVYFFSQAISVNEAVEEAEMVLDYIDGYDITYPVAFDIEDAPSAKGRARNLSSRQVTDIIKAFCDTISEGGYRPMIYTNARWYIQKMDMSRLTKIDKWFAQYYDIPFFPYKFQIWQYTGKGRVDGIKGDVDMNLCFTKYN